MSADRVAGVRELLALARRAATTGDRDRAGCFVADAEDAFREIAETSNQLRREIVAAWDMVDALDAGAVPHPPQAQTRAEEGGR